jgi:uncharacterized protein (TIGR02118 family)
MICITFLLRRKPDMAPEEFHRYWRDEHGPLARSHAEGLGMLRYTQLHSLDPVTSDALRIGRDCEPAPWDGVALVWFESLDALAAAASTEAGRAAGAALLEDERRFLDLPRCQIWITEEHPVIT